MIKVATKVVNVELDGEDIILQVNWVQNYPIYKNVKEKKFEEIYEHERLKNMMHNGIKEYF